MSESRGARSLTFNRDRCLRERIVALNRGSSGRQQDREHILHRQNHAGREGLADVGILLAERYLTDLGNGLILSQSQQDVGESSGIVDAVPQFLVAVVLASVSLMLGYSYLTMAFLRA